MNRGHVVKSESMEQKMEQKQDDTPRVLQEVDVNAVSTGTETESDSNIITTTTMDTPISYTLYAPSSGTGGEGEVGDSDDDDGNLDDLRQDDGGRRGMPKSVAQEYTHLYELFLIHGVAPGRRQSQSERVVLST